jgi:uncharacterized glyoxalase superfamily protein PhnB
MVSKIPALNNLLLELHVPNFGKVKDYYIKLGFKVVWERKPEEAKGYLILKMENTILCFWPGTDLVYDQPYFKRFPKNTVRGYGVEIVIMVDDINAYYEKVKGFANIVEPLVLQPWGIKDFRIADPFGYYLRICPKHNILDSSKAVK